MLWIMIWMWSLTVMQFKHNNYSKKFQENNIRKPALLSKICSLQGFTVSSNIGKTSKFTKMFSLI
jgi:hypothetical protein